MSSCCMFATASECLSNPLTRPASRPSTPTRLIQLTDAALVKSSRRSNSTGALTGRSSSPSSSWFSGPSASRRRRVETAPRATWSKTDRACSNMQRHLMFETIQGHDGGAVFVLTEQCCGSSLRLPGRRRRRLGLRASWSVPARGAHIATGGTHVQHATPDRPQDCRLGGRRL